MDPMEPTQSTPTEPQSQKPPKQAKVKLPSPQERLELILLGLIREETVDRLCRQAGVSRALFYQWMRRGRESLLQALETRKPGRPPAETKPAEVSQLKERMKRLEKELAALRRENGRYQRMVTVAQRVIQRNGWNPEPVRRIRKKKDTQMTRPGGVTIETGSPSESTAPAPPPSPASGASAPAPIADGLAEPFGDVGMA